MVTKNAANSFLEIKKNPPPEQLITLTFSQIIYPEQI